ncbi:hypothetical protein [Flagellimonas sp.]
MAKKKTQKKDSSKSEKKTQLNKHKRSSVDGKNQKKGTGPRDKK